MNTVPLFPAETLPTELLIAQRQGRVTVRRTDRQGQQTVEASWLFEYPDTRTDEQRRADELWDALEGRR